MPEYLIFFNDDWVTEATDAGWQQRSRDVRAVVDEMKAAGVFIFTGGLDNDAPVFHVEPGGGTPMFTDGPFTETKEVIGGFAAVDVPQPATGRDGSPWPATGRKRYVSSGRTSRFPPPTRTVPPQPRGRPMTPDRARPLRPPAPTRDHGVPL